MNNYYSIIDKIRENINKLNSTLIEKYPDDRIIKTVKKKKISKGNVYSLNQIQWRQKCINYRRDVKKFPDGKVKNYDVIDNISDMEKMISNNEYKKNWGRLDKYQKKKKIKEFVNNLSKYSNEINNKLFNKLSELVDKDIIKKTSQVEYDKETCKIISIKCLELNDSNYKVNI